MLNWCIGTAGKEDMWPITDPVPQISALSFLNDFFLSSHKGFVSRSKGRSLLTNGLHLVMILYAVLCVIECLLLFCKTAQAPDMALSMIVQSKVLILPIQTVIFRLSFFYAD